MNLTRAQKVRLGTFMVTGTVLFVGGVATLTGLRLWERRDTYSVYFADNVSGLEPSAPVKYQGLRVGRVDRMRVAPDDPGSIEVTLSLDPGSVLYRGTKAVLDQSGLTGLKSINLIPGDPREGVLEPGARLPAEEAFLDRLSGQAEQIAMKVELAANNIVKWTDDDSRVRFERLLESVTRLADEMDQFLETNRVPFQKALHGVAAASTAFTAVAGESERAIAGVRHGIDETLADARRTLEEIRRPVRAVDGKELAATVSAARSAMVTLDRRLSDEEMGVAISDLRTSLQELTRLLKDTDLAVRAGRDDFTATLKYVRQAAEDLREFSRIIAQNPSALISGRE